MSHVEEAETCRVEEAARRLGISRATAYDGVRRGDIPSIRIGRAVRIPKVQLDRLIEGTREPAA